MNFEDLKKFCGVQTISAENKKVYVFQSLLAQANSTIANMWSNAPVTESITGVMASCVLDANSLDLKTEHDWCIEAAKQIYMMATDDTIAEFDDNTKKFAFMRRSTRIGQKSRRGFGCVILGDRTGLELISPIKELPTYDQFTVVQFENGEVQQQPWAMLGYHSRDVDTGAVFARQSDYGSDGRVYGTILSNSTDLYWIRLV